MNSELDEANCLYDAGKYIKACKIYTQLASEGNFGCSRRLGWMYFSGLGVQQDWIEAERRFKEAEIHGDSEAQFGLGQLYLAKKNFSQAQAWFEKAALNDFPPALYRMGWLCLQSKSDAEAKKFFTKASKMGHVMASRALSTLYFRYFKSDYNPIFFLKGIYFFLFAVFKSIVISCKDISDTRLLY